MFPGIQLTAQRKTESDIVLKKNNVVMKSSLKKNKKQENMQKIHFELVIA